VYGVCLLDNIVLGAEDEYTSEKPGTVILDTLTRLKTESAFARFTKVEETLKKLVPVFLAGILALTACGTAESPASTDTFESAEELVDAINAHTDLTCSKDLSDTQSSLDSEESWDSMRCENKGMAHYLTSDGAKAVLLDWLEENGTSKTRVAMGDNWIFVGYHHQDAHAVRTALDGVQPNFSHAPAPSEQDTARDEPKADGESDSTTASAAPEPAFEDKIELSGAGDDIVELDIPGDEPAIAHITHDGSSNFQVTGYTTEGERAGSLVNEIGPYEGTRPVNLRDSEVKELDITADGSWTVVIQPLFEAPPAEPSGATEGSGDAVLLVADNGAASVEVSHTGESNFQVTAWGSRRSGMINEIGVYEGRVRMPADAVLLEIVVDGSWSFNFD